jgi:solute:Na+ symporter, SSS family
LLTGGLGGLFIMGIFIPRIGSVAALIGVAGGVGVLVWVKTFTAASFLLYGFTGIAASVVIAFMVSLLLPGNKPTGGSTWRTI